MDNRHPPKAPKPKEKRQPAAPASMKPVDKPQSKGPAKK